MGGDRLSSEKRTWFSPVFWSWATSFSQPHFQSKISFSLAVWFGFVLLGFFGGREIVFGVFFWSRTARMECTARVPLPKHQPEVPAVFSPRTRTRQKTQGPKCPGSYRHLTTKSWTTTHGLISQEENPNATDFHWLWGSGQQRKQEATAGMPKYKKPSYYSARLAPSNPSLCIFFSIHHYSSISNMTLLMNIISCACTLNKVDSATNCCSFQNTSKNKYSAAKLEIYISEWYFVLPCQKTGSSNHIQPPYTWKKVPGCWKTLILCLI